MIRIGRLGFLALGVAGMTASLIAVSRWVGRQATEVAVGTTAGPAERSGAGVSALGADLLPAHAPELSFYRALGPSRSRGEGGAEAGRPDASRPRPRDLPIPGGDYIVQALATGDAVQARRVRARLARRGLPAVVAEGRVGDDPIFRVRLGPYRDRQAAEAVARRLAAEESLSPWVLQEQN